MKHRWTTKDLAILSSNSTPDAARIIGVSEKAVKSARRFHGIPSPECEGSQARLFAEDVAQIMMLRASGFTCRQVAQLKSITHTGVLWCIKIAELQGFGAFPKRSEACSV